MGAVRKLATVVIVGLVALSTLLVVYLASDSNLRNDEVNAQDDTAIEEGTQLYITYCLQCHGPHGYGAAGGDGRIGGILNQSILSNKELDGANAVFQSDDPVQQQVAEDWIRFRVTYGIPPEPNNPEKQMPAFGQDLNVEQVNALVYMIMHVDWNYVYNEAVTTTGETQMNAMCTATPTAEGCDDPEANAAPLYPTAPAPSGSSGGGQSADSGGGGNADASNATIKISATEMKFDPASASLKPGDTIAVTNDGAIEHDFSIDQLGINEALPVGETVVITIPDDAKPGDYHFYCNVTGHEAAGMKGTLTVEAP